MKKFDFMYDTKLITIVTDDGYLIIERGNKRLSKDKVTEIKNPDGTQRWKSVEELIENMQKSPYYKEIK